MKRIYVYLFLLIPAVAANIDWKTETNSTFTTFTCINNGNNGTWHKKINGSYVLLANITNSTVSPTEEGKSYSIKATLLSNNKKRTSVSQLMTTLTTTNTNHGEYKCSVGDDSHLFHIKMTVFVSSTSGTNSLQVSCKPPTQNKKLPPHITLWFLNATHVATAFNYMNGSDRIDYKNTSFTEYKNFTYNDENKSGIYNGTYPGCITCVVSTNSSYGDATRCTSGIKDLSSGQETESGIFRKFSSPKDFEDPPFSGAGTHLLVITLTIVAAIICAVFIIHVKGKTVKMSYKPNSRIYKNYETGSKSKISTV